MDRNKMLLDFASDWTLDGDLLRCRDCKRAQIASRQDEDFVHRSDCKKLRISGRPWSVLQAILLTLPSGVSVVDQLAAVESRAAVAAQGRVVKPHPKNVVAALLRAIEAKDKLLVCYRLNGRPSESLFKALNKADQAVIEAKAWLEWQEALDEQPQDGAK